MSLPISPDNDTTLAVLLKTPGPYGRMIPATGLSVTGYLAASPARTAGPLDASLSVPMTESPADSGYYTGVLRGAAITAQWTELLEAGAAVCVHYASGDHYHEVGTVELADPRTQSLLD